MSIEEQDPTEKKNTCEFGLLCQYRCKPRGILGLAYPLDIFSPPGEGLSEPPGSGPGILLTAPPPRGKVAPITFSRPKHANFVRPTAPKGSQYKVLITLSRGGGKVSVKQKLMVCILLLGTLQSHWITGNCSRVLAAKKYPRGENV